MYYIHEYSNTGINVNTIYPKYMKIHTAILYTTYIQNVYFTHSIMIELEKGNSEIVYTEI